MVSVRLLKIASLAVSLLIGESRGGANLNIYGPEELKSRFKDGQI
jgi:hypothetical protein